MLTYIKKTLTANKVQNVLEAGFVYFESTKCNKIRYFGQNRRAGGMGMLKIRTQVCSPRTCLLCICCFQVRTLSMYAFFKIDI